jgi:hypothetical protein
LRVRSCQSVELAGYGLRRLANRFVTANQIGIRVDQYNLVVSQTAGPLKIKKHGTASEKRLDVAIERRRVVASEFGQELALPANPFE